MKTSAPAPLVEPPEHLTEGEAAVWRVLYETRGRVVTRGELARKAGLRDLSVRRVDVLLVGVRRELGPDQLLNIRGRGWLLCDGDPHPVAGRRTST